MKSVRSHGAWIRNASVHYRKFQRVADGQRNAFFKDLAAQTGHSTNTLRRQLSALGYLVSMGVEIETIEVQPALMSVEAVARAGRLDAMAEARLLRELLKGQGNREYFRGQAAAIEEARWTRPLPDAGEIDLPSLLAKHIEGDVSGAKTVIAYSASPLEPYAFVETPEGRVDIYRVSHQDPRIRIPHFRLLLLASVLASLVSVHQVIVCTDIALIELADLQEQLRLEIRSRLTVLKQNLQLSRPVQAPAESND